MGNSKNRDRSKIRKMLSEGYGVEDIANAIDLPLDTVRKVIGQFREAGELEGIWVNE